MLAITSCTHGGSWGNW